MADVCNRLGIIFLLLFQLCCVVCAFLLCVKRFAFLLENREKIAQRREKQKKIALVVNRVKNELVADARRRTKNAYRPNIHQHTTNTTTKTATVAAAAVKATRLENLIISDK